MSADQQRPNIVFLFPDQFRWDFAGANGADWLQTPNIDSIAENGVRYTNSFSSSPICVPARTALMTGMNAVRNGVTGNLHNLRADWRDAGLRTWPEIMGENGYYTAGIGKMHFYPWDERRGFQYRVICEDKRWLEVRDDYYHYLKRHGLRKLHGNEMDGYQENRGAVIHDIPWEHSWDRFVGSEAVKFIDDYGADQPFAMMVGFPGPHCPYDPDERFLEGIDESKIPEAAPEVPGHTPELRQQNVDGNKRPWNGVDYTEFPDDTKHTVRKHYSGLVQQIDFEVGAIIDALRKKGLLENTYIVLSSDHGDYLGDFNLLLKGALPFNSITRVPFIWSDPDDRSPRRTDALASTIDLPASILERAGLEIFAGNQGKSFLANLDGSAELRDELLIEYNDSGPRLGFETPARVRSLVDGRYRMTIYQGHDWGELYDLETDPDETRNLWDSSAHEAVKAKMSLSLAHHLAGLMDESPRARRLA